MIAAARRSAITASLLMVAACRGEVVLGDWLVRDGGDSAPSHVDSDGGTGEAPPPRVWPDERNTGASGDLTPVDGDVGLDRPGQIYENVRLRGTVTVDACDVVIRNVEIISGSNRYDVDLFAINLRHPSGCSVTLDHVTVKAAPPPNDNVTNAIRVTSGSHATLRAIKIVGAQTGVLGMGAGLVEDSYILAGASLGGQRGEAFQVNGAKGLTLRHNTILNPNGGPVTALAIYTGTSRPNVDVRIENNLLAGGGNACSCGDGNPERAVNVDVVDNVFFKKYFPAVGADGPARAYGAGGGGEWTNNFFMTAGGALTADLVPRPNPEP